MMAEPLSDGAVQYIDGTETSKMQMAKDVTAFLVWAADPHIEARQKMGFKVFFYLIFLFVFFDLAHAY